MVSFIIHKNHHMFNDNNYKITVKGHIFKLLQFVNVIPDSYEAEDSLI